jgi:multidrug efflux pump subunit AcrA (membrane-fusion protein)
VETGIEGDRAVQIVSGLKAGEQVVTTGAYGLPDNTAVKIEPAAPAGKPEPGEAQDEKGGGE